MVQTADSIGFRRPAKVSFDQPLIPTISPNQFRKPYDTSQSQCDTDSTMLVEPYSLHKSQYTTAAACLSIVAEPQPRHRIDMQLPPRQKVNSTQVPSLAIMPSSGVVRRHARVQLSLDLANAEYVAGGLVAGRLRMSCHSRRNVRLGEMWVELQGYEEVETTGSALRLIQPVVLLSGAAAATNRYAITATRACIQTATSGLPKPPVSKAVDPATGPDVQGCWQAHPGCVTIPWQIRAPEGLPSTFTSRTASVCYRVVAGVDVVYRHKKVTLTASQQVLVYESLDPHTVITRLLATPVVQEHAWVQQKGVLTLNGRRNIWSTENGGDKLRRHSIATGDVRLRARVNRSIWQAGSMCCVDVSVKTNDSRRVAAIKLALLQTVCSFRARHTKKGTIARSRTEQVAEYVYRGKAMLSSLSGPLTNGWRTATLGIIIPENLRSIRNAHRLSVMCTVQVTLVLSWSSRVTAELPIVVAHPKSLKMLPAACSEGPATLKQRAILEQEKKGYPGSCLHKSEDQHGRERTPKQERIQHGRTKSNQVASSPNPCASNAAEKEVSNASQRWVHTATPPARPRPPRDDPVLNGIIIRQRASYIQQQDDHEQLEVVSTLNDSATKIGAINTDGEVVQKTGEYSQSTECKDSTVLPSAKNTWHRRFSVDDVGKSLEQILLEARHSRSSTSSPPKWTHCYQASDRDQDQHRQPGYDHDGSGKQGKNGTSPQNKPGRESVTRPESRRDRWTDDEAQYDESGDCDRSAALFSPRCHKQPYAGIKAPVGIYDSIVAESREWDDILGRLWQQSAREETQTPPLLRQRLSTKRATGRKRQRRRALHLANSGDTGVSQLTSTLQPHCWPAPVPKNPTLAAARTDNQQKDSTHDTLPTQSLHPNVSHLVKAEVTEQETDPTVHARTLRHGRAPRRRLSRRVPKKIDVALAVHKLRDDFTGQESRHLASPQALQSTVVSRHCRTAQRTGTTTASPRIEQDSPASTTRGPTGVCTLQDTTESASLAPVAIAQPSSQPHMLSVTLISEPSHLQCSDNLPKISRGGIGGCTHDLQDDDLSPSQQAEGLTRLTRRLVCEMAETDRRAVATLNSGTLVPPHAPFVCNHGGTVVPGRGRATPAERRLTADSAMQASVAVRRPVSLQSAVSLRQPVLWGGQQRLGDGNDDDDDDEHGSRHIRPTPDVMARSNNRAGIDVRQSVDRLLHRCSGNVRALNAETATNVHGINDA
ncbi:hypothetical protein THASP1DRAFT_32787 [Thamnocephalis sphaerospora]|uniref:Arrestin C-terminal-like domain-containing protein n=1 Tax=Thamnocephalis sphaerospora TaxID=78915 RepID=A0A4P9XJL1_9FUNG|nr:hypothetical protein THASP1DRAFT_32787 [Thamnocephalis sphaerospora]|eukprot:RKP05370.1 hypothetical protein THASP1DRAFT_32787 [Thamnocephalis sphaerospora]